MMSSALVTYGFLLALPNRLDQGLSLYLQTHHLPCGD